MNCCHLIGKTEQTGLWSGVWEPSAGPGMRTQAAAQGPKDGEGRTESRPLCASGQGYCWPTRCLCGNQRNKPLPKQALSRQEPASSLLQRAFILTPSPKSCFSLFFLNPDGGNSILQDKVRSPFIFVLFDFNSNFPACFSKAPQRWSVLPDPKFSQKKSKFPQNLICTFHPLPLPLFAQALESSVPRQEHLAAALGL